MGRPSWEETCGAALLENNAWGGHFGKQLVGAAILESNALAQLNLKGIPVDSYGDLGMQCAN